ncbi:YncE family protein [Niabella sp. 22666]|uniref:YncE family protein n=1 Tax=Niabella sp. 22666 TaxID=3453954 RepID=UPI003F82AAD5
MAKLLLNLFLVVSITLVTSCSKDKKTPEKPVGPPPPPPGPVAVKKDSGVYVLSTGAFYLGVSKVGYYDFRKNQYTEDYFKDKNPDAKLSGTCYGGIQYGEKCYVFLSYDASKIMALDKSSGKMLAEIASGVPYQSSHVWPKKAIADKNLLYVAGDGYFVHVLDTSTLNLVKSFAIPQWASDIIVQNNKLFVSNKRPSGLLSPDTSLLVMDMNTGSIEKNINFGAAPQFMLKDNEGFVYLYTGGGINPYDGPFLHKIDASTLTVVKRTNTRIRTMVLHGTNNILAISGQNSDPSHDGKIPVYDRTTLALVKDNFITDGTKLTYPRHLYTNEKTGDVYIIDVKDGNSAGQVYIFDKDGKKLLDFATTNSIFPVALLFNY